MGGVCSLSVSLYPRRNGMEFPSTPFRLLLFCTATATATAFSAIASSSSNQPHRTRDSFFSFILKYNLSISLYSFSLSTPFLHTIKPPSFASRSHSSLYCIYILHSTLLSSLDLNKMHSRKRKLFHSEFGDQSSTMFPLNDLNQDLLERLLSWLPTSSFFRLSSVCKRWRSVADSNAFKLACSRVPARHPWFFMLDSRSDHTQHPIIFDSAQGNWKKLNPLPLPLPLNHTQDSCASQPTIPVAAAAAAGLLCFLRPDGAFLINNPVTGSCRHLDSPFPASQQPIRAIAMTSEGQGFKLVTVSGELPHLKSRQYSSITRQWEEEVILTRKDDGGASVEAEASDDCTPYFLSKCGNVVSAHIQRSPSKQYSSILIDDTLYYLSSSGTVVACNLTQGFFFEYPRLLPVFSEYSIDLVECGGRMLVVLLSEFLETASLRVWSWDEAGQCWSQTAAMPPCMSHKLYGKKADINCSGAGGKEMLLCVNSGENCRYVMCDLVGNEWVELPHCCIDGQNKDFVSALSFEPRIEALAG